MTGFKEKLLKIAIGDFIILLANDYYHPDRSSFFNVIRLSI